MTRYSVQPRDRIFVKSYGFLSFAKDMGKNIGKNISKNLSGKYSPSMLVTRQKLLDHAKKSAIDVLKTSSKRFIQKITVRNEHDKEIPKEKCISPEERQKIIDNLRSVIIV